MVKKTYLHGIPSTCGNGSVTPGAQEDLPSDGGFHKDLTQILPTTRVQPAIDLRQELAEAEG